MSNLSVALTEVADRTRRVPFVLQDLTGRAFDLSFSSALPGGMMAASFSLLMRPAEADRWYEINAFKGIHISEGGGVVWEGRISHIKRRNYGVDLDCEGYWSSMADQLLYAWYADNQMGNWRTPSPGAGGISDDISLAGVGKIDKFSIGSGQALLRIGVQNGELYELGDKAVFYYELPDISALTDDRPFGPNSINSIQFTWDMSDQTEAKAAWNLKVWVAETILGDWFEVLNVDIRATAPQTYTVNLSHPSLSPTLPQVVAIGVDTIYPFVASGQTGEHRILIKDLTAYAEPGAVTNQDRKTTARKIIVDLLAGQSRIGVVAHAKGVLADQAFIESTDLEIIPAIFSGRTLQEIASELVDFGVSKVANLVDNPSLENDVIGWSGPSGGTDTPGSVGANSFKTTLTNGIGEGIIVIQRGGKRFPVIPGRRYSFSIDLISSSVIAIDIRLNWFGVGSNIFELKKSGGGSALKDPADADLVQAMKDINAGVSTSLKSVTTNTKFTRHSISAKAPATATHVQLEAVTPSGQGTPTLNGDAARLIDSEIVTYIDGDQHRGVWEGNTHGSRTIRFVPPILGVFGNRILQLRGRDEREIRWHVTVRELGEGGLELEKNMLEFYTRVWADYSEAFTGKEKFQDVQQSLIAEALSYDERDFILNLQGVTGTVASRITKAFAEDHNQLQQRTELEMTGAIANSFGAREPLWRVRAGDLLKITDLGLSPVLRSISADTIDNVRTFLVKEAEYDTSTGTLTIVPDFPPARMDLILARLGITPSLVASGQIFGTLNPVS